MRFASKKEIEYLSAVNGDGRRNARLIREMSRQLDALRRFDQRVDESDWRPRHTPDRPPLSGAHFERAIPGRPDPIEPNTGMEKGAQR